MKTEQEQIEEIVKILLESSKKCFGTDCDYCDKQYEKDCAQYRKAVALVQAGYGDVSEYKAEIGRLKEVIEVYKNDTERNLNHITVENGQLKAKNKVLGDGVVKAYTNGFTDGRKQVEKDIRRTKIDVLNELKCKYGLYYLSAFGVKERMLADILTPMIEELKK